MKLIIQIPCYNEEGTLAESLHDLPKTIDGIDAIEYQIIDDGSTDDTVGVARANGVHRIISMGHNTGLARAFMTGISDALQNGADIIVNTDADHPYSGKDIEKLVKPIIGGEADIVVGCRDHRKVKHFTMLKRMLQIVGAWFVSKASGVKLPDVTSGFRAYSREAAMRINVLSSYSYTLESLIQAGRMNLSLKHIMVEPNPELRPSRLYRNIFQYVARSAITIMRITILYYPLRVFLFSGIASFLLSFVLVGRYLYYYSLTKTVAHIPSLVLAGVLVILGIVLCVGGFLADLIAANRMLLENTLYYARRALYGDKKQ